MTTNLTARHYYAFNATNGGASWANSDGLTATECGSLHRFASVSARDEWVSDEPVWAGNGRRAVTVRSLPMGHRVYGRGAGYYEGPGVDTDGLEDVDTWVEWCDYHKRICAW